MSLDYEDTDNALQLGCQNNLYNYNENDAP